MDIIVLLLQSAKSYIYFNVPRARNTDTKKPGSCPSFLGLRRLNLTAVWPAELVRVQYLRVTDIGDARIIVEKLPCDLIRNLHGHIPIFGEYLDLYIGVGAGNAGLSRRAHVTTALTASVYHRVTGSPGFVDDLGDLFQQQLFRDDDELDCWLCHVNYLLMCVSI